MEQRIVELENENAKLRQMLEQANNVMLTHNGLFDCFMEFEPHEDVHIPTCNPDSPEYTHCSDECVENLRRVLFASYVDWFEKHRWSRLIQDIHTTYCDRVVERLVKEWRKDMKKAGHSLSS